MSSLENPREMGGEPYQPTVPVKVRDIVYWAGFIIGGLSLLTTGLVAIWAPEQAQQVSSTALVIGGTMSWISSALGVAYRPGSQPEPYRARYKRED